MKVIILAGGGGKRLWPLSTPEKPKQFIKIINEYSFLQNTIKRFDNKNFIDEIVIVTSKNYEKLIIEQINEINIKTPYKILYEPFKRNTAYAIALGVLYIKEKNENNYENILISPADHYIVNEEILLDSLEILDQKKDLNKIVTFGIKPNKPETNYGYIKILEKFDEQLFHTEKFIEKPDIEKAKKYISSENFFWNSGMFFFSINTFEREINMHFDKLFESYQIGFNEFEKEYESFQSISFDFAIMEKTKNNLTLPLNIIWSDLGLWKNLYDILQKDKYSNVFKGKISSKNTKRSLIFGSSKPIYALDIEDLFIIETKEAILIGKRESFDKVEL